MQASLSTLSNLSPRRIIAATIVILAVGLGFWLLYHFRLVVFLLFTGIVIGTAMRPASAQLQRFGLSARLAGILAYLALIILLGGVLLLVLPLMIEQLAAIATTLPDYYHSLRESMVDSPSRLIWRLGNRLPQELTFSSPSAEAETEAAATTMTQLFRYSRLVIWTIFITIGTLVISFYWTLEDQRAIRTLTLLLPLDRRDEAQEMIQTMQLKVGAFIRGQAFLGVLIGLMSLVAYWLIGLPYVLVLALLAGLMEVVPYIGPLLGALPAFMLVLSTDPTKAIWVVIATLIIQQIENTILLPRIMDRSVGVNSIVTLLSIAAFGSLFGLLGAILAIPMAAVIQMLLDRFLLDPEALEQDPVKGRGTASVLRYAIQDLIQDLRKRLRAKDVLFEEDPDLIEEEIEAIATDLDALLAEPSQEEESL
jgi:predicted PurR-regulated permease PerM